MKIVEVRTRLLGYRKLDPPMQRSLALGRVETDDGTITAPSGPGLGVDVDEDLLDAVPYVAGDTYADVFPEHESGRSPAPSGSGSAPA
jgi:hypothetical protein